MRAALLLSALALFAPLLALPLHAEERLSVEQTLLAATPTVSAGIPAGETITPIATGGVTGGAAVGTEASSRLIYPNPNPGQKFPLQGDCAASGIDPANPGIDLKRGTWACHGGAGRMARIFYTQGPQDCVYIDNDGKSSKGDFLTYFIPLDTSVEWMAFKQNLPGGVRLRFGCMGAILKDPCGNRFAVPDAPASNGEGDVITVDTQGGYRAEYRCLFGGGGNPAFIQGGCGTWTLTKETGQCTASGNAATPAAGDGLPPIKAGIPAGETITPVPSPIGAPPSTTNPGTGINSTPGAVTPVAPSSPGQVIQPSLPGGETITPIPNP